MSTFSTRQILKDSLSHTLISFSINKTVEHSYNRWSFWAKQGSHCYPVSAQRKKQKTPSPRPQPHDIFRQPVPRILGSVQFPLVSGNTDSHYVDF